MLINYKENKISVILTRNSILSAFLVLLELVANPETSSKVFD